MKKNAFVKRGDLWLIAVLLAVGLAAAIILPLMLPPGGAVSVERDGRVLGEYPLDTDMRLRLDGSGGYNTLVIENGRAYIESADCPKGVCTAHPPVSKEGETIICRPHRLVIRVVSRGGLTDEK